MQKYKDLAKKLFDSQKNNFADFAQTTNSLQFVKQLQPKTYYETYKDLYYAAIVFSVLAQIATAISSYAFFVDLFAPKIQNPIMLVCVVVVVLAIIETMKYIALNKALLGLFSLPKKENYVLLAFALLLSLCSVYASVVGGGNLGIDMQKVVTVKSKFDTEIAVLRSEIAAIQNRNTYKGNTYISGKDKTLLHTKETQIQALQAKKDNELIKVSQANENNANTFKIGFGLFDLLFLLCTLYAWNFRKLVALETLVSVEILPNVPNRATAQQAEPAIIGNQNAIPNQQNKIGFDYDFTHLKSKTANENHNENHNENRITCLHCGIVYVKKHHKQKYCCENCRIAAWELRTNTKLITKKS
jgi:hypothetical protein